jgi:transketolase
LICCKTTIGYGAPNVAGTDKVHGSALGEAEIAATRKAINWPHEPFEIPQDVYDLWDARSTGAIHEAQWNEMFSRYSEAHPDLAAELERRHAGKLPDGWKSASADYVAQTIAKRETLATRKASQLAITAFAPVLPEFLGGSADLTGSNFTDWPGVASVQIGSQGFEAGRYIHYGVREFGMSAIQNGIVLHGGYLPFSGTFLTFSDYSRNALRMAALMKLRSIFVFTHDSIGLGEDGPTHQSIEHVSSLRLIPNLNVWRPADTTETAVAWANAIERRDGPTALVLSRQNLPFLAKDDHQVAAISLGAYILRDAPAPRCVLLATGSEVGLAVAAHDVLAAQGIAVRVVSVPSTSVFDRQDSAYKAEVLPNGVPRLAIEAGVTDFWWKYVGSSGAVIGIDTFGESAPAGVLFKHFGLVTENVVATVEKIIAFAEPESI